MTTVVDVVVMTVMILLSGLRAVGMMVAVGAVGAVRMMGAVGIGGRGNGCS